MITHAHTQLNDYTSTHTPQPSPYREMITNAHTHTSAITL